ncbi:hypothetical protein NXY07_04130 [Phocaeicola dorei]|nr:hypothetical protein [Phocaeicola dorei]
MKFNHIFLSVALSAALMGSFTSCDDFLAEDPYAFVGPDQVGNDNVAVNLWVTGVYSKWANDMFRWQNFPRVLEMDCDYTSGPDWAFSNLGSRQLSRRRSGRCRLERLLQLNQPGQCSFKLCEPNYGSG